MDGVLYVLDQLGRALARANERIEQLEQELAALRQPPPEPKQGERRG